MPDLVQARAHDLEPERARDLQPLRVDVDDRDHPRPVEPGHLRVLQAHRAGAVDEVRVTGVRLEQVEAVDHAADRLDQGRRREGHALRHRVDAALGHRHPLGEAAGSLDDADRVQALAQVLVAALAEVALAAAQRRVDPDPVADLDADHLVPDVHDRPAELVADHDGVGRRRELAVDDVDVRPADPAGRDLDHHVLRPGDRLRDVLDRHLVRRLDHHCLHYCLLARLPRICLVNLDSTSPFAGVSGPHAWLGGTSAQPPAWRPCTPAVHRPRGGELTRGHSCATNRGNSGNRDTPRPLAAVRDG
ncbi:MAG: hypothetical protein AVDCRST_MAG21-1695 [uncultured Nocardioidaceae bacterium]|uniref:Uncharacterized protein n=1 Tax=uncultured Nocardioidaceae bacterium TaxID=253824 RepID=A0A6J4N9I5_9ACTN|nr:MAG: hypothetical protein AVDCRST_MAG21-1695 [uncultured Nocardioidaceae bacterium]